jgi:mRNA-degrading endonuclease toxin of MazEF toxin-antitoxin module
VKDAFALAGFQPNVKPGEVWKARDSVISLVDSETRHWHEERYCVVLSNNLLCATPNWPIVLIVPLSHILTPLADTDLLVEATKTNGLTTKSRLILSHIQPIRKTNLQERVGIISLAQWDDVIKRVFWQMDRV